MFLLVFSQRSKGLLSPNVLSTTGILLSLKRRMQMKLLPNKLFVSSDFNNVIVFNVIDILLGSLCMSKLSSQGSERIQIRLDKELIFFRLSFDGRFLSCY